MVKQRSWTVTDLRRQRYLDELFLGHGELGVEDCTVSKRTFRGGLADGVDVVTVHNGELSFSVLPTRGMGIWKADFRGIPVRWSSPVQGPVHPKFVNLQERGGLGWLYGFDEMMCRCGLDSNGAPGTDVVKDNNGNPVEVELTLHGRIANLPAHRVEVIADSDAETVTVRGEVDESALFCPGLRLRTSITTERLKNRLTIVDEVDNLRATPSELELLYHCNFGEPFLDAGAQLLAPVREAAPRDPRAAEGIKERATYLAPTPGYVEQVYFYRLHADDANRSLVALRNQAADRAVVLRFDTSQLPCFTQWKNTAAIEDGYVTGLEPGTNYPNPKRIEREKGRVVRLAPQKSYRAELSIEVVAGAEAVGGIEKEIASITGGRQPEIHGRPVEEFSGS